MSTSECQVIIPHPNQIKILTDFQKILTATEPGRFFPAFPLYVKDFKSPIEASSFSCVIENCRIEGGEVIADALIEGENLKRKGRIVLAKVLDQKAGSLPSSGDFFPLKMRVFRLAQAVFTNKDGLESWEVTDERWVKALGNIKKPAHPEN